MAQTVFDRIKTMPKDELQKLIYYIYLWGHMNEQCNTDDEYFYQQFLDLPSDRVDCIIDNFDKLQPAKIREISIDGGGLTYWPTKFYDVDDARIYLEEHINNIVKVDDMTYATSTTIYKIIPCDVGKLS